MQSDGQTERAHPIWFMWRPAGKVPVIKGPFLTIQQALTFGGELYEINKSTRVSVLDLWAENKLGGESLENFMCMYGDRRTRSVRQYMAPA